jgi:hypothetical protein
MPVLSLSDPTETEVTKLKLVENPAMAFNPRYNQKG